MARCCQLVKCLVLDQVHFVVILLGALPAMFVLMHAEVIFSNSSLVIEVFHLSVEFELSLSVYSLILELLFLDFVVLRYHDVDLRVENELLSNDLELELVELLDLLVVVPPHLLVLLL